MLLRSSIAFRSENGGVQTPVLLVLPGNSEINQGQLPARSADHIRRLHIPVNDRRIPGVQILEDITELNADIRRFSFGKRAFFLQQAVQAISLDIVHDEIDLPVLFQNVHNVGKRRMIHCLHKSCLHQKATGSFPPRRISSRPADFLHRPVFLQSDIHGQINHRHSAFPDYFQDFIFPVQYFSSAHSFAAPPASAPSDTALRQPADSS